MATQHPDNATPPFWEKRHDGFINSREETLECVKCFFDFGVDEFMWDWEGRYADEAVVDRLLGEFHEHFKKHHLGKDKFLTFRIPNVWKEKGYNLIRALMVVLTSEDFARDLKLHALPLFEIILPMTERAEQLMYIQTSFRKLARFKTETFNHRKGKNKEYLEMIPLIESVENQLDTAALLERYIALHKREFKSKPEYVRPFLARSDPALVSGLVANVLANKIALSDIQTLSRKSRVPMHPILGAGSLVFRGGLNPNSIKRFVGEYGGVRTATIQSAFRYDYGFESATRAIKELASLLPATEAVSIPRSERQALIETTRAFEASYQRTLSGVVGDLREIFLAVPKRRERRQHIGLIAYARHMGHHQLPRAINFTAGFYSIGLPPEFIGMGAALKSIKEKGLSLALKYYKNFRSDIEQAGRYLNRDNLKTLRKKNPAWSRIANDIQTVEDVLGVRLGPKTWSERHHESLTGKLLQQRHNHNAMRSLITETGVIRRSLG